MQKRTNYNLKENEITIHLVFNPYWEKKPFLDFMEELQGYLMIVNSKKDMRRIGLLMKTARKLVEIKQKQKSNFDISKFSKIDMQQWKIIAEKI